MTRRSLLILFVPFLAIACASAPPRTAQECLDAIRSGDETAWHSGIRELTALGADAVPVLATALASDDELARSAAQWSLMQMGPEAELAVPALIETLERVDFAERWRAVSALGRIGPASRQSVPTLIQMLEEDAKTWEPSVVWALGRIGPDAHEAIPVLASLLAQDDYRGSHASVREALRRILAI